MSTFKPGQLRCVTTLDSPVAVSAGAGSGKTFTLTQRIAWALMEGSAEGGGAFLDNIGQVLAITFTEKAAGEIKSRVKGTLRAEGMAAAALAVDDAWISTIHGMCSRILHAHAIELGLDPAFSVLSEARAKDLFDAAVESALAGQSEFAAPQGADALFGEYPARSAGPRGGDSIEDMVRTLARTAAASPQGCDCFVRPPAARPAGTLVRALVELAEGLRESVLQQKQSASRDAWVARADEFLERACSALESDAVGGIDAAAALGLADAFPFPAANFGTKPYKEHAKEAQRRCSDIVSEMRFALAEPLLDELLSLTRGVYEAYRRAKRDAAALDNDDLIIETARALRDYPEVARQYVDKFKLVMVDEFQDTDQLQVDIVSALAGARGERLCTVGDVQQSIYRFRGADVGVYRRQVERVRAADASMPITLPDNFRSHGDVLRFVDRIFEKPEVFGAEFMSLSASRDESKVKRPFLSAGPRIDVLCTTYRSRGGVSSDDATALDAARIAARFADLRGVGHAPGDMVVLLGRMTHAGVYAEALREQGFACVISGGSIFASAPETRVMVRLAQAVANPRATAALFELLSSEMFALSADDFLELATRYDEKRRIERRRSLDAGFATLAREAAAGRTLSPQLAQAVSIVAGFAEQAGSRPLSRIMADAVRDSGWLTRLEERGAEGLSIAGNVMKAIRLVEGFEREGALGPASAASMLASHVDIAKEAPGALSATGGDFVRIMTVHASKGLEFPIVAVAEMALGSGRSQRLSCDAVEGATYVTLAPGMSVSGYADSSMVNKCTSNLAFPWEEDGASPQTVRDAATPAERRAAAASYVADQELQERRRLMYVALTRAKEALVVGMVDAYGSKTPAFSSGVYADVRRALFGEDEVPDGVTEVDFGGERRARIERIDMAAPAEDADGALDAAEDGAEESAGEAAACEGRADSRAEIADGALAGGKAEAAAEAAGGETVAIYAPAAMALRIARPAPSPRDGVTSYSALAQEQDVAKARAVPASGSSDADEAFWDGLSARLAADADKATDVGEAFHTLAQYAVGIFNAEGGASAGASLRMPDDSRIAAAARACGLRGEGVCDRLARALSAWVRSDVARDMERCGELHAELPFFVAFPVEPFDLGDTCDSDASPSASDAAASRENAYLEGSIDLIGYDVRSADSDRPAGIARIVDYKTGGEASETADELSAKHLLQASCYAYAALLQGFASVEATFVRVEQRGGERPDQPQCVRYAFSRADMPALLARIQTSYSAARAASGSASARTGASR